MSMTIEPTKTDLKKTFPYPFIPSIQSMTFEKNLRSLKLYRAYIALLNYAG